MNVICEFLSTTHLLHRSSIQLTNGEIVCRHQQTETGLLCLGTLDASKRSLAAGVLLCCVNFLSHLDAWH